jgi:succinate dehydrogenase / fumarate reductase flavoprotein subunit
MYEKIAGEDPYKGPMMIYPAVHYTMGGLWVDYNLMSNVPGLHVLGEANFSDHGANRLGASALMQGLADGYFVIPTTIANYLVTQKPGTVNTDMPEFKQVESEARERVSKLFSIKGKRTVDSFHRELGMTMWDNCGMARSREGLDLALAKIPQIREEFWNNVLIPGSGEGVNMELEKAGRVADFLEFAEMMCYDARDREESCGGHFRSEHQFFDTDLEVQSGKHPSRRGQAPRRPVLPRFLLGIQGVPATRPSSTRKNSNIEEVNVSPSAATRDPGSAEFNPPEISPNNGRSFTGTPFLYRPVI